MKEFVLMKGITVMNVWICAGGFLNLQKTQATYERCSDQIFERGKSDW